MCSVLTHQKEIHMRTIAIVLALLMCSVVSAQSRANKEAYRAKKATEKQAQAQQQAELAKFQQEYNTFLRTGALPQDPKRADALIKSHELRLKHMEAQAKAAKDAPKGKWVWRQDLRTGRMYDYFLTDEEEKRSPAVKLPTTVTGTLGPQQYDGSRSIDLRIDSPR